MIRRSSAVGFGLLVLLLGSLPGTPARARGAPRVRPAGVRAQLEAAYRRLASRPPLRRAEDLRKLGDSLAALPREDLSDEDWLDLHLLLLEVRRRLDPIPPRGDVPFPQERFGRALPDPVSLGADPAALLTAARTIHLTRAPADARPPDRAERTALAALAREATDLGALVLWPPAPDDALLTAAREVLSERLADYAFDLRCRAEALLPSGTERFEWMLENRHGLPMTAEDARRIGEEERTRALAELEAHARAAGDGRTWRELTDLSREDRPGNSEELLTLCRTATAQALAAAKRSDLIDVPAYASYLDVRMAQDRMRTPYAHYRPGKNDARGRFRGTAVYIRLPKGIAGEAKERWLRDRSRHWMKIICAHEGVPGHHLQYAVASRVRSPIRRLGHNSLYVEGWGLYSEEVMERIGWYDDPLTRLAWLRMKLWRAVRVLIDVGLHTGTLGPAAAVDMLTEEVGLERHSAEQEVRRYLTMPTQPLSYTLGHRRITELRETYLRKYGEGRDREFHDRFLALGAVPLDLARAVLLAERDAYDRAFSWP